MELVMLGSNAFAHIVEALILWISMSQMYETKYKQLFTGCSIFLGHIVIYTSIHNKAYHRVQFFLDIL